jgi:Myb superfamily proteins, including transcription factors and mRNA splicing factors
MTISARITLPQLIRRYFLSYFALGDYKYIFSFDFFAFFSFPQASTFLNTIRIQDNEIKRHGSASSSVSSNSSSSRALKGKWTKEEDERLKDLCLQLGIENWAAIGSYFPHRTEVQCQQRWRKVNLVIICIFCII